VLNVREVTCCGSDRVPPACSSSGPTTQCFEGQCGCTDRLIGIGESQFKCILSIKPVFWFSLSAVQPWFIHTTVNIGQSKKCRMIANIINFFQGSLSKRNLNLKGKVKSICICRFSLIRFHRDYLFTSLLKLCSL